MPEEDAELFHRSIDAINRRDLEAFVALMDQDVRAGSRIATADGFHGHAGIRQWWDNWLDAFPDYQLAVVDIRPYGDALVATFSAGGHGATSGVPFEDNAWLASRWRNGRCIWWQACRSEAEALEAAGLSE
jgi:ketosteroid isomerase-like protein